MSLVKQAAFVADLVRAELTGAVRPLSAIVNLTDRCNLSCAYCYAAYHHRGKPELTTGQMLQVLTLLRDGGCRRVSLAGGEPLMREDLSEILAHARALGLMATVNSNGVLVPRKLKELAGVDTLCISLDGGEKAHDVYRGAGSHRAAMLGISAAREAGIPLMSNTVLTKRNLDQVDEVLETARAYGFQALFNVSIGLLSGKGDSFKAGDAEVRAVLARLIELKRAGAPVLTSEQALRHCLDWPDYSQEFIVGREPEFPYIPCLAGRRFVTVDTDGGVYPCGHLMTGAYQAKNILEHGLEAAMRHCAGHDCRACYHVSHNEFNLLFAARPAVLANMAAASARRLFSK